MPPLCYAAPPSDRIVYNIHPFVVPDEHDVIFDLSVVAFPEFRVRNELFDDRTLAFEEPPHLLREQGRVVEAQLKGAELKQKQPETRLSKKIVICTTCL